MRESLIPTREEWASAGTNVRQTLADAERRRERQRQEELRQWAEARYAESRAQAKVDHEAWEVRMGLCSAEGDTPAAE